MKEKIIKKGSANWSHGFGSKGGTLVLTDSTLYFEGHMFNAGKKEFEVEVKDIIGVSSGFLNTMVVSTTEGDETFVVNGKNDWIEEIESLIRDKE